MDGQSISFVGHILVTKMKVKLSSILIIAVTLILCGCTQFKRSTLSIGKPRIENNEIVRTKNNKIVYDTIGTIFVWNTDVSTAVMNEEGYTCIQRALTTKDITASGALSDSILNLSKTLAKTTQTAKERELLSIAIAQTSTLLTTTTERTAFLDTGLFYICQLAANKALTKSEVVALSQEMIKSAAGLKTNKASTVTKMANEALHIAEPKQSIVPTLPNPPKTP